MMPWLAAVLLLQVVADGEPMRLVSSGTGTEPVHWFADGNPIATTRDGAPAQIFLEPGPRELRAWTPSSNAWEVLARGDSVGDGVRQAPSWSASNPGAPASFPVLAVIPAAVGIAICVAGPVRSALEAGRASSQRGD